MKFALFTPFLTLLIATALQPLKLEAAKTDYRAPTGLNLLIRHPSKAADDLILWRLDDLKIKNDNFSDIQGRIKGRVHLTEGRFDKALQLQDDKSAIASPMLKHFSNLAEMTIDFWVKLDAYPAKAGVLFEFASNRGTLCLVKVDARGKLELSGEYLRASSSEERLPIGKWAHITIGIAKLSFSGRPSQFFDSGVRLSVNGFPWADALVGHGNYIFPPKSKVASFSLGNDLDFKRGLRASFDEFHISRKHRDTYPRHRVAYSEASKDQNTYRNSHKYASVFSFDNPDELDAKTRGALDFNRESESSTLDLQETRIRAAFTPGVNGNALHLEGGSAKLSLEGTHSASSGTITFWFKPSDWDNQAPGFGPKSPKGYANTNPHLITIYARGKKGSAPKALTSLALSRILNAEFPAKIQPHRWTHVAIVWGKPYEGYLPLVFINGTSLSWNLRTPATLEVKAGSFDGHVLSHIEIGNPLATHYDEIRISPYAMSLPELENRYHEYLGKSLHTIQPVDAVFDYQIASGMLNYTFTLLDPSQMGTRHLVFRVHAEGAKPFRSTPFVNGISKGKVKVGALAAGQVVVSGELMGQKNKNPVKFKTHFKRWPTPWHNNTIGLHDTPPPPFEPVRVDGSTIDLVLRRMKVGAQGHFQSIRVLDEEILHAPITLSLNGSNNILKVMQAAQPKSLNPSASSWQSQFRGAGLRVSQGITLEYDGMTKLALDIEPEKDAAKVDEFSLVIKLKPEFATLAHMLPVGGHMRDYEYAGYLPKKSGRVWDSKSWREKHRGAVDARPLGNFVKMVWLGGIRRGLCWFADNDEGWFPSDEHPALSITRHADHVELRVRFIASTQRITRKRRIVFGLMATPAKPLPENHRLWNRGRTLKIGPIGGMLNNSEAFDPWEEQVKFNVFENWPLDYDWRRAKRVSNRQRQSQLPKYRNKQALILYHNKKYIPIPREGYHFLSEWQVGKYPAFTRSKMEMLLWYMNQWIGDKIVDGVFIDDVFPVEQASTAYRLPDGRLQPGACQFQYREYLKRLYHIFHKNGLPPLIVTHMTSSLSIPYHSFATFCYDGENKARFANDKHTYIDAWPIDRLLTLDNAQRTGIPTSMMFLSEAVTRGRNPKHWEHMLWKSYRSSVAIGMLFDLNNNELFYMPHDMRQLWQSYCDEKTSYIPFWGDKVPVQLKLNLSLPVTKRSDLPNGSFWKPEALDDVANKPVRVSCFRKRDRVLLVFVNFLKRKLDLSAQVDLKALGLENAQAKDVDTWPAPEGIDVQNLDIDNLKGSAVKMNEDEEGLDIELEDDKQPRLVFKEQKLELSILPHNFRLIELK